jgi:sugar/nucleoside kinase (ribokinase family)
LGCPDYVVIGTVCQDITDSGFVIGGTVAYSGLTAARLGRKTGAITSFADDFAVERMLPGIQIMRQRSSVTTTYQNVYVNGQRQQYVRAVADQVENALVPDQWKDARIVHLGPLVQEVQPDIIDLFPHSLIGITPQGWMRRWDDTGRVYPTRWSPPDGLLQRTQAVILSEEDVGGDLSIIEEYAQLGEVLVLTSGWKGSSVYCGGQVTYIPARDTQEIDPTGAGDVYAAAFLVRLDETGDPLEAAAFANLVASCSVARRGIDGIPTRREIAQCRKNSRLSRNGS